MTERARSNIQTVMSVSPMSRVFEDLPPLSLYVHLPWCERKCPYCDFNSYQVGAGSDVARYTEAICHDLRVSSEAIVLRPLESVFFGGGTPSLFPAESIAKILDTAERIFAFAPDIEITLEANPGSAEQRRFNGYRTAGVNRLSIGVQSLRDTQLARLGRVHTSAEARDAVKTARRAGFENFNLDLMFGLPEDTLTGAMFDLDEALEMGPGHLSWYQLTLEPNTHFAKKPPTLPNEALLLEIEQAGRARLIAAGFTRYEISAWAGTGGPSRHNLNYWNSGDYVGVGAGAHGKWGHSGATHYLRTERARQPERYMRDAEAGLSPHTRAVEEPRVRMQEFLMNGLRLIGGFPTDRMAARTGVPETEVWALLDRIKRAHPDWVRFTDGHFGLTEQGLWFADTVLLETVE